MITLYELRGADRDFLFSPFCWRVRTALAFKGLDFDSEPVCFTDKELIAFSGQGAVPVIVDGEDQLHDSVAIFRHLDKKYPQKPLLGDALAEGRAMALDNLTTSLLRMGLVKMLALRVYHQIADKDKAYFRETREKMMGTTLEAFCNEEEGMAVLTPGLNILEALFSKQPYLDGDAPAGADFLMLGHCMWAYTLGCTPWDNHPSFKRWFDTLLADYESKKGVVKRV